jgi:hypothetical protein
VKHEYDPDSGELSIVSNALSAALYWKAVSRGADLQLTKESFGNLEQTSRQYFGRRKKYIL